MSANRAIRRSEIARFRRTASSTQLVTHLLDTEAAHTAPPLLQAAIRYWQAGVETRRPICIGCKGQFAGGKIPAAAWLLAESAAAPGTASVSAICSTCWTVLRESPDELDRIAAVVLQKVLPGGGFRDRR